MTAIATPIATPFQHYYALFGEDTDRFDLSLMHGLAGAALISAYLGAAAGAKYSQLSKELQTQLLRRLNEGDLKMRTLHTLCAGLAGTIYALDQLHQQGFSEHSLDRATRNSLTDLLVQQSLADFEQQNTDFLHGPLGVFFVLLADREDPHTAHALDLLFDRYRELLVTDHLGSRIYNSVLEGQLPAEEYNFGLAHGMAGHIFLWSEAHARGYRPAETAALVADLLRYVEHYRLEPADGNVQGHKFYPKSVIENNAEAWEAQREETYNSRLGWCYGDLNIAFAQLKAGRVFGRADWQAAGLQLAIHTTTRSSPVDAQINGNAFFCHGASGLGYMYGILHEATGEAAFRLAQQHWYRHYDELWLRPTYADLKLRSPGSLLDGLPGAVLGTLCTLPGGGYPMADALLLNL